MIPSSMAALEEQQIREENKNEKMEKEKKKGQGKSKIEIKLIESITSRQVTFSKRRGGLFSKAGELCALCGAEIAIVAFSGAGKLFSFGHPSVDSVILRYLNSSSSSSSSSMEGKEEITHTVINGAEKKMSNGFWWDDPIDENLGLDELEVLKASLEGLRNRVALRFNEILSLMGYDNLNYNNNVGFEDEEVVDFGGMGWGNFSQDVCDLAWMGHPYPVHNMAWMAPH
uniref:MADS-box domain-containing protein n=2 Tax=Opuntia streptacantha TaxID=393608 RepID=A0A7C8ZQV8_OPUST